MYVTIEFADVKDRVSALKHLIDRHIDQVRSSIVRLLRTSVRATLRLGLTQEFARAPQMSLGLGADAPYKLTGGCNV